MFPGPFSCTVFPKWSSVMGIRSHNVRHKSGVKLLCLNEVDFRSRIKTEMFNAVFQYCEGSLQLKDFKKWTLHEVTLFLVECLVWVMSMNKKHTHYGNWKLQQSYSQHLILAKSPRSDNKAIHKWREADSDDTLTTKVKFEWLIGPSKFNSKRGFLFTASFFFKDFVPMPHKVSEKYLFNESLPWLSSRLHLMKAHK